MDNTNGSIRKNEVEHEIIKATLVLCELNTFCTGIWNSGECIFYSLSLNCYLRRHNSLLLHRKYKQLYQVSENEIVSIVYIIYILLSVLLYVKFFIFRMGRGTCVCFPCDQWTEFQFNRKEIISKPELTVTLFWRWKSGCSYGGKIDCFWDHFSRNKFYGR